FGVTILPMVPSVVNSTLSIPFEESDISCLQVATSGTAPLSPTVAHEFEARTEAKIIEGYGLTETTAVSAANPRYGESRIGSIGFRKAYQPMKVVEIDASGAWQRDCAPGETGIVAISGPNVIPGYLDESANDKLFVAPGWLNTGDIGHQDQDGYFWLTGRAKDLIIRGGHNLDPKLIEEAFYAHEAIAEAAAVGMPDAKVGELPVVYVTLKPGKSVRPGRLNFHAYEAIQERAAVPKQIHILDTMPKTAVGKIQKNILRDDAVRRCAAEIVSAMAPLEHWRIETETGDGGQIRCAVHVVAGAPNAHSIFAKACEQMKSLTAPITVYPSPKQS
ncbi:MAG: AMP-binding protein, partial [Pseudomonadota bacterium]